MTTYLSAPLQLHPEVMPYLPNVATEHPSARAPRPEATFSLEGSRVNRLLGVTCRSTDPAKVWFGPGSRAQNSPKSCTRHIARGFSQRACLPRQLNEPAEYGRLLKNLRVVFQPALERKRRRPHHSQRYLCGQRGAAFRGQECDTKLETNPPWFHKYPFFSNLLEQFAWKMLVGLLWPLMGCTIK